MTNSNDQQPKLIVGTSEPNVQGSAKFPCVTCKADVWLARSGQRMVSDERASPLCMDCLMKQMESDPASEIELPSKQTVLEDLGIVNRN